MKIIKYFLGGMTAVLMLLVIIFISKVHINEPLISGEGLPMPILEKLGENSFVYGNNRLHKNDKGLWEMYLEGKPYERGVAFGVLGRGLMEKKEAAFVGEIKNRVPSETFLTFLKYVVGWMNRDLDEYVPHEQLLEIYGSSQGMPDAFDFVGPKFHRALSYHAAHDIGHALQNMNLVGCTSFATWGERSEGNKLLIGRNFDFYFGEDFAQDKIVAFYKPDSGYQFMSVTWAGFSGVVSGMNEQGLTVTLNSAKSKMPTKGKTPVSIIGREILQYAATIDEAYTIASSYESFVAETFLIGSKADGKVGLIEKTPGETALYLSNADQMVITNHFQSDALYDDPLNQEYMAEEVSPYRYRRVEELIDAKVPLNPMDVADILRDKDGLGGADIGLGNEKSINQLIAHHAVIFSPDDLMVWVSSPPYQLGDFLAYDLNKIFHGNEGAVELTYKDSLSIAPDPFLFSGAYEQYAYFAKMRDRIQHYLFGGKGEKLTDTEVEAFQNSNPNGYLTYYYLGEYFKSQKDWERAKHYYEIGLAKEVAKVSERRHMEKGIEFCNEKLK